ncbi:MULTISPECIES: amidohydrolase family protein [Ramlibacter]|uniref:Amidohydrolase family protein n=1 Tax=Ramlibacter pinisoli TaxID=2682844 RepID=A0A6N8IXC4_9BURK|nr:MULTISPECIES: amidohydrolase family protein [Ramlibacter]MBA2961681.1 amidohydrolase family protein [Ramlibacter sp. CGMCC 1.13660]MVQ31624.1 amidohydrolase family protein [Ramlibacter pinisoli]
MTAVPAPLPAGACDCHVHVFGPAASYPFAPARAYTPADAPLFALRALHRRLGMARTVIVQPSPYGSDNACLLDALAQLGDAARGVAVIDDTISGEALAAMHAAGVRGVRVNLETAGEHDPAVAGRRLMAAARRVAPLGWHVQTYTSLATLAALAGLLPDLPTTLVIDHFGRAQADLGTSQAGFDKLLSALASGRVYVKLSAPYRISRAPGYADVAPLAQALIDANPDRVLWGTDWPHPGTAAGVALRPEGITPFRDEDNARALARCLSWAGTAERVRKLLVDNPARLYMF